MTTTLRIFVSSVQKELEDERGSGFRLSSYGDSMTHKKKLIEVALPLDAINKASAREKSIRNLQTGRYAQAGNTPC